jgi:hypothetical protein
MKKLSTLAFLSLIAGLTAFSQSAPSHLIKSNLYVLGTGGDTTLLDGDLTQYDPSFSNNVDGMDARKMNNFSENIGMLRGATTLVIERRHTIENNDTIFYKIWNLNPGRKYQLQFVTANLGEPGLTAYLEDQYLNTKTPVTLNGTTYADIAVSAGDPASSVSSRFRIIFATAVGGTLPVTFTAANAYRQNNAIKIDWETSVENNLKQYFIERSVDGSVFKQITTVSATNLPVNNYVYMDNNPCSGINYYRIGINGLDGNIKYSDVMKVDMGNVFAVMKVFPNPVSGNSFNLRMVNQPKGIYDVKLITGFGQVVFSKEISHDGGNSMENIKMPQTAPHGIYRLEVKQKGGIATTINMMY